MRQRGTKPEVPARREAEGQRKPGSRRAKRPEGSRREHTEAGSKRRTLACRGVEGSVRKGRGDGGDGCGPTRTGSSLEEVGSSMRDSTWATIRSLPVRTSGRRLPGSGGPQPGAQGGVASGDSRDRAWRSSEGDNAGAVDDATRSVAVGSCPSGVKTRPTRRLTNGSA